MHNRIRVGDFLESLSKVFQLTTQPLHKCESPKAFLTPEPGPALSPQLSALSLASEQTLAAETRRQTLAVADAAEGHWPSEATK